MYAKKEERSKFDPIEILLFPIITVDVIVIIYILSVNKTFKIKF